jgi:hypothetical protein
MDWRLSVGPKRVVAIVLVLGAWCVGLITCAGSSWFRLSLGASGITGAAVSAILVGTLSYRQFKRVNWIPFLAIPVGVFGVALLLGEGASHERFLFAGVVWAGWFGWGALPFMLLVRPTTAELERLYQANRRTRSDPPSAQNGNAQP